MVEKLFEKREIDIEHSSPETDLVQFSVWVGFKSESLHVDELKDADSRGPRGKETKRRKYIPIQGQVTAQKKKAVSLNILKRSNNMK
jgi:hypothetical protein